MSQSIQREFNELVGKTNHSHSSKLSSMPENSTEQNHTGCEGDTAPRSAKRPSTSRQPIVHDEHFCAICSKPFKYRGSYSEHMKEQCHLRILRDPCGMGYVCRFCSCPSFEDANQVIRHLWDHHSLDVENLVFHEHCADCYWQKTFSGIDGPANAAFDAVQRSNAHEDSGSQKASNGRAERTFDQVEYFDNLRSPDDISRVAIFTHFHDN